MRSLLGAGESRADLVDYRPITGARQRLLGPLAAVSRFRAIIPLFITQEGSRPCRSAVRRRAIRPEAEAGGKTRHPIRAEATLCPVTSLNETALPSAEILRGSHFLSLAAVSAVEKLCALPRGPNVSRPLLCYLAFLLF